MAGTTMANGGVPVSATSERRFERAPSGNLGLRGAVTMFFGNFNAWLLVGALVCAVGVIDDIFEAALD